MNGKTPATALSHRMRPLDSSLRIKARRIFLRNYQLYLLMLPGLAATLLFQYGPMYGIQIAFKDYRVSRGIWGSEWVGLAHFSRFLSYPGFWEIVRNTLSITLYGFATFPLSILLALQLNEIRSSFFKKIVQTISYAPYFLSTVVLCGMVLLFLNNGNGLINNIIETLGGERIDFLTRPDMFADIYVWSGVWQGIGWGSIIYLAALSGVSPELIEAALIDGANRLRIIWHINLPAIAPIVTILLILSTGGLLSLGYEKILLLQNNLNMDRSRVVSTYVYEMGLVDGQFSYSTAINLFNNVVNFIVLALVNTLSSKISEVSLW